MPRNRSSIHNSLYIPRFYKRAKAIPASPANGSQPSNATAPPLNTATSPCSRHDVPTMSDNATTTCGLYSQLREHQLPLGSAQTNQTELSEHAKQTDNSSLPGNTQVTLHVSMRECRLPLTTPRQIGIKPSRKTTTWSSTTGNNSTTPPAATREQRSPLGNTQANQKQLTTRQRPGNTVHNDTRMPIAAGRHPGKPRPNNLAKTAHYQGNT